MDEGNVLTVKFEVLPLKTGRASTTFQEAEKLDVVLRECERRSRFQEAEES